MRPIHDCGLPYTGDQTLHLLEDLAAAVKLPYLSDLRALTAYPLLLCALDGILPAQYAPADWRDALHYFAGKQAPLSATAAQIKELLVGYLSRELDRAAQPPASRH